MNDDWFWDWRVLVSIPTGLLILMVVILRISLWLNPPKSYDPKFTSRSITGWTNTPRKLAWSNTIEKVSHAKEAD